MLEVLGVKREPAFLGASGILLERDDALFSFLIDPLHQLPKHRMVCGYG